MTYARFVQSRNMHTVHLQRESRLSEQVPIFRQRKDIV
jgi:hypothetical protein